MRDSIVILKKRGIVMRRSIRTAWLTLVLMLAMVATALANYPGTLDGGNLVLVDGGMGVGYLQYEIL